MTAMSQTILGLCEMVLPSFMLDRSVRMSFSLSDRDCELDTYITPRSSLPHPVLISYRDCAKLGLTPPSARQLSGRDR